MPVAAPQNDRDDSDAAFSMSRQSTLHLDVVAIVRRDKVRTDKQQNDLRFLKIAIDFGTELLPCLDSTVMPGIDQSLALQGGKVRLQLEPQHLIFMGIRESQFDHIVTGRSSLAIPGR